MIREPETTAFGTNLPQHRRQSHQHPVFLLTVLLTLNPPACHEHGFVAGENFRQLFQLLSRHATHARCPLGGFLNFVALAEQVLFKLRISGGVFFQEGFVVKIFLHQRVGDP